MTDKVVVPSTQFPPIRSSRVAFGMGWSQIALLGVAMGIMLIALYGGGLASAAATSVVWAPLGLVATVKWRGRALMDRVMVGVVFGFRKLAGQTSQRVSVNAASQVTLEDEQTQQVALPGMIDGRHPVIDLMGTSYPDACIIFDKATGLVTAAIRCQTDGWLLTDPALQASRADALGLAMKAVAQMPGVAWVKTHARTFPVAKSELMADAKTISHPVIAQEYSNLVGNPMLGRIYARDVIVTITVRKSEVEGEIRGYGGGRQGLGRVMFDRVEQVGAHLASCGVNLARSYWLGSRELLAIIKQTYDPSSVEWISEAGGVWPADRPLALSAAESWNDVRTDEAIHRTWWIEEWPRMEVAAGFLGDLVTTGSFTHTVTQIFTSRPIWAAEKALADAEGAQQDIERRAKKAGRTLSTEHQASSKALEQRRKELVAGHGDVGMVGFVTVSADGEDELASRIAFLRANAPGMLLNPIKGQQYAAFVASMLPVGGGVR